LGDLVWPLSSSTIPAKVEEQYQGKNIEFVSISVDNIKIEKNGVIL
jgi:hypothetical protein